MPVRLGACGGMFEKRGRFMGRFFWGLLFGAIIALVAIFGVPDPIEDLLCEQAGKIRGYVSERADGPSGDEGKADRSSDGAEDSAEIEALASDDAAASPEVTTTDAGVSHPSTFEETDALRRSGVFKNGHLVELYTCPGMTIVNVPFTEDMGRIAGFKPKVSVSGVVLATAPVASACLSSHYGIRNGKLHKGLDYHSDKNELVFSAGGGTILEAEHRADYGNMIVIDHGQGVYTRYAHLKNIASGVKPGASVSMGQQLGHMGQTASYSIPIHLHLEFLTGDYNTGKKSFGLETHDPLSFPAA